MLASRESSRQQTWHSRRNGKNILLYSNPTSISIINFTKFVTWKEPNGLICEKIIVHLVCSCSLTKTLAADFTPCVPAASTPCCQDWDRKRRSPLSSSLCLFVARKLLLCIHTTTHCTGVDSLPHQIDSQILHYCILHCMSVQALWII